MEIEDKEYQFTIWDTAGQEKFRTLLDIFYKGSDGCFIVFDVTVRKTFEKVLEWRDQFLQKTDIDPEDKFQFIVLGNKCDVDNREISEQEARDFLSKTDCFTLKLVRRRISMYKSHLKNPFLCFISITKESTTLKFPLQQISFSLRREQTKARTVVNLLWLDLYL